jgi:hypothetical protein
MSGPPEFVVHRADSPVIQMEPVRSVLYITPQIDDSPYDAATEQVAAFLVLGPARLALDGGAVNGLSLCAVLQAAAVISVLARRLGVHDDLQSL